MYTCVNNVSEQIYQGNICTTNNTIFTLSQTSMFIKYDKYPS